MLDYTLQTQFIFRCQILYYNTFPCFISDVGLRFQVVYFHKKHYGMLLLSAVFKFFSVLYMYISFTFCDILYAHFLISLNQNLLPNLLYPLAEK